MASNLALLYDTSARYHVLEMPALNSTCMDKKLGSHSASGIVPRHVEIAFAYIQNQMSVEEGIISFVVAKRAACVDSSSGLHLLNKQLESPFLVQRHVTPPNLDILKHFTLQRIYQEQPKMAPSPPTSPSPDAPPEDDDTAADLPLTMAASVVLDHLPKDAHKALETAGELEQAKGTMLSFPTHFSSSS